MNTKIQLLVIDPQNDFMDIPGAALPVPGADADMKRLARFIDRVGDALHAIRVTLDSHHPVDIAHPIWWSNVAGENPAPFTTISVADVRNGIWAARNPLVQSYSSQYVEALEVNGRYQLLIWPPHCLIGSWGHNVQADVFQALSAWGRKKLATVDFIPKGSNPKTEHYSAVQAEVPDPSDAATTLNSSLISSLQEADVLVIAGEALSHCVASTIRDIANHFDEENIRKLVLLTDCASAVPGFEKLGKDFVREMMDRGMQTAVSTEYLR